MDHADVELLAIGAGPANLALAVALEELAPRVAGGTLLVERQDDVAWQPGMLLPWARTQVSFLKDLVTLRNPRSEYTFTNYLHATGQLDEFVNLGTLTPYRVEISGYLNWVAKSLPTVRIDYGRACVDIEPLRGASGVVDGWRTRMADGSTVVSRHLAVACGRDPHIPEVYAKLPRERVIHSTEYCRRVAEVDPAATYRIAVVGGAQSAAELLWAAHQGFPHAECVLVARSAALWSYEHSKFANELYFPAFVPEFFAMPAAARSQVLDQMHHTNYGAADPEMLDLLYRQVYLERVTGTQRMSVRTMTEAVDARIDRDEVVLTLLDGRTGAIDELRCDLVLLGTGYRSGMPGLVRRLTDALGLSEITVDRGYRLTLPAPGPAACYLQGLNESTHGIADSLLSVLAVRAGEIATDLLERWEALEGVSAAADHDQAGGASTCRIPESPFC